MTPAVIYGAPNREQPGIVELLERYINEFMSLPDENYALPIALWILGTHCYDMFHVFGFLLLVAGNINVGKSTMLKILKCLCHQAEFCGGLSVSGMGLLIGEGYTTLLIDEAHRLLKKQEDSDLMIAILGSYTKGPRRVKTVGSKADRTDYYGPKAFVSLGSLTAEIRSRGIEIRMQRNTRQLPDFVIDDQFEDNQLGGILRRLCAKQVLERREDIETEIAHFEPSRSLINRERETWKAPLVMCSVFCPNRLDELRATIAKLIGGKRAKPIVVDVDKANEEGEAYMDGINLLHDMRQVFAEHGFVYKGDTHIRTETSLLRLWEINDAIWRNYAGVGLTDMKMAELLAIHGVHSHTLRIGRSRPRGYYRADIVAALKRLGLGGEGGKAGGGV